MMTNTLIDNSAHLKMVDTLRECINTPEIDTIRIATGYWDIPGTALILEALETFLQRDNTKLKLLIGKDPYVYYKMVQQPVYKDKNYPKDFIRIGLDELAQNIKPEYKGVINLLLQHCESGKIEIHIFKTNEDDERQFFHSKCYIFTSESCKTKAYGIIGSSNFTEKGLQGNSELNYFESVPHIVRYGVEDNIKGHVGWFEEKWAQSQDWTKEFLEQVLKPSKPVDIINTENAEPTLTPYEVYIKYLQNYFGDLTDESVTAQIKSYLPRNFSAFDFQIDAVKQCFHIMKQYGGFILADVVGLGKTVVALLVVKRFIEEANNMGQADKVLIITPPAIRDSWERTIKEFDAEAQHKMADNITIVSSGSIGKFENQDVDDANVDADEFDNALPSDIFGLIMIDESHNFRNSSTQKYRALDSLIDNITQQTGNPPYVGLMSATPQNNSPQDIKNQIYLFERNSQKSHFTDILGGRLDSFFAEKQRIFNECRKDSSPEAKEALKNLAADIRKQVLDHIVVRRTRTDIQKYYSGDANALRFPTVCPPHKLEYEMDDELINLFAETVSIILPPEEGKPDNGKHLGYYRYMAINFFKDFNNTKLYEKRNLTVNSITQRLATIMQILLVKRLESSFEAFKTSLSNLKQYTANMLKMLDNDCVFICPDIDVNQEMQKAGFNFDVAVSSIRNRIANKQGTNREFRAQDFSDKYRQALQKDYDILEDLCERWKNNDLDPKMDAFKDALKEQLFNKDINNPHGYDQQRLVIFTEAISTQETLCRYLKSKKYKVLSVSAATRDELQDTIRRNFDANSTERDDDYNVLVTTEVLSEGVNLHRANVLLNYDTPWNATRLMQRIGRVNRIGSKEDFVHVFNFFPTSQSNQLIHLIENAYAKLQAFHTMFGEDNQVFTEMEELSEANFNSIVNGEESVFASYLSELKQYAQSNPQRYAALKALELKDIGVSVKTELDALMLVNTDKNRQSCIRLNLDGENQDVVSPLLFMQLLKERIADDFGKADPQILQQLETRAIRCFQSYVNSTITGKDSNKRMKDALKTIHEILPLLTTDEAKTALKQAKTAISNGNFTAMRIMEKYKENQGQVSLFGIDDDINQWVVAMFGKIAKQTTRSHGTPYVALYNV
ncbi:MAG: DEAD/DEAH box helicase family protein [Bacteroidales bacterium]|nr:DEAD/DEAH box helicase family protein [Bacteroidales bacterium]